MWYAKPKWGYEPNSTEGTANILEMNGILNGSNYTLEAQTGIITNSYYEGGLNPWRWENEEVIYSNGYGLFQYTPASGYFNGCSNLPGYSPNTSVSQAVAGATPEDGYCQVYSLINDTLNKWDRDCWRDSWSTTQYATLYSRTRAIINTYGSGGKLSLSEFSQIDNIDDAVIAFLCSFEKPGVPNYTQRLTLAPTIYAILSGDTPTPPEPPTPPTPPTPIPRRKLPIWMMIKRLH